MSYPGLQVASDRFCSGGYVCCSFSLLLHVREQTSALSAAHRWRFSTVSGSTVYIIRQKTHNCSQQEWEESPHPLTPAALCSSAQIFTTRKNVRGPWQTLKHSKRCRMGFYFWLLCLVTHYFLSTAAVNKGFCLLAFTVNVHMSIIWPRGFLLTLDQRAEHLWSWNESRADFSTDRTRIEFVLSDSQPCLSAVCKASMTPLVKPHKTHIPLLYVRLALPSDCVCLCAYFPLLN